MEAITILLQCRLFAGLAQEALAQLARLCVTVEVAGGDRLFSAGELANSLYIVVTGRLRALRPDGSVAGDIDRLEVIGEISLLTGEPRSAEVYALRDSVLLRIQREQFLKFATAHPSALLEISRVVISRMRQNQRRTPFASQRTMQTLTLLPADPTLDLDSFATALGAALPHGARRIGVNEVDKALGPGAAQTPFDHSTENRRLVDWLSAGEVGERRPLYCATGLPDAWTERCIRQADRILVIARERQRPESSFVSPMLRRLKPRVPIELVMLHDADGTLPSVAPWRAHHPLAAHHHLVPDSQHSYARLARLLNGASLGLVLGGGGARGFAHIGLIQALEELRLPIDLIGGSSMGAFFAGLIACGADSAELRRIARATFVEHNYLNDFVLPRVSLIRGRRFFSQLKAIFSDTLIEELHTPFFCVSTNLTRGIPVIHEQGPLATWVATSMAVPGIAPPMVVGGDLLVDGALVNSLPVDVMRSYGRGPVIASDVSTAGSLDVPGVEGPDPEALLKRRKSGADVSLSDILFRSATLSSEADLRERSARADLYLRMPVNGVGLFDWKRIDDVIERSYRYAVPLLEEFRRAWTAAHAVHL